MYARTLVAFAELSDVLMVNKRRGGNFYRAEETGEFPSEHLFHSEGVK